MRLAKEKATMFRKERDIALAKLERVQKARSTLEMELQEHEKSCQNTHNLTRMLHYELLNCKAGLSEAKVECNKIFALMEKKAAKQWYLISHQLRLCTLLESRELRKKHQ